jgi:penicillin V acylase-like amidase (Ntn superfamily)
MTPAAARVSAIALLTAVCAAPAAACTALQYIDANGAAYAGRTLELQMELPYQLVYVPPGAPFSSRVEGQPALDFTTRYAMVAVTMPARMPTADAPLGPDDLKALEGMNTAGLSFSLLAYPSVAGPQHQVDTTQAVLSAIDLGSWALGQFATVDEVRDALADQPVLLEPLDMIGGALPPVHFVLHDADGGSIVVEFDNGERTVYDNPVGVMTNGPAFSWHLTNLANYTHLDNLDQSTATFGGLDVSQPDSGIATAGLPASNTSVGRFVRAAYYSQFAEKVADPDAAVQTVAHIMNNFDRPRGITLDSRDGGEGDAIARLDAAGGAYSTEYTSWTTVSDLARDTIYLRTYDALNFVEIDLGRLAEEADGPRLMTLDAINDAGADATDAMLAAPLP